MSIRPRGWTWLAMVAVLAIVALFAVRWALSSPGRRADDAGAATAEAAAEATEVARSVAATLTADSVTAASDATSPPPEVTRSATRAATAPAAPTEDDGDSTGSATSEPTDAPAPTTAPVAPTAIEDPPVSGESWIGRSFEGGSIGDVWRLVDTRLGRHEGFTRVVWEFQADAAAPRWRAIERDMSSGAPLTLPQGALSGTAWLEVQLTDVIAMEAPQALEYKASPGGPLITGVAMLRAPAGEEDDSTLGFAVGLARPTRFQVVALDDPARLVLDVFDSP